ncbi:MAG: hypothetical protein MUE42_08520 [Opitutaceae bacterium]|jgi:hypothetical protein|nr:hypothetical protein [Opitutaceae bacterium]
MTPRILALACLLLATPVLRAQSSVIIDDSFDDGDPSGSVSSPGLWKLQAVTGDNGVFENNGTLTLFATTNPFTFAGINTSLDSALNFFARPLTLAVEEMILDHKGIPDHEAVFRLSLNSTEKRQNMSPQSLSIRFVPGAFMMGFKTGPIDKLAAEDVRGAERGAACFARFEGRATAFRLSLDPHAQPGSISYTLTVRTNGPEPVITRQGTLDLRASDWNADGRSALVMEARRNHGSTLPDTYMSATLGRLTVTSP